MQSLGPRSPTWRFLLTLKPRTRASGLLGRRADQGQHGRWAQGGQEQQHREPTHSPAPASSPVSVCVSHPQCDLRPSRVHGGMGHYDPGESEQGSFQGRVLPLPPASAPKAGGQGALESPCGCRPGCRWSPLPPRHLPRAPPRVGSVWGPREECCLLRVCLDTALFTHWPPATSRGTGTPLVGGGDTVSQ